jgi:hypothetical protein
MHSWQEGSEESILFLCRWRQLESLCSCNNRFEVAGVGLRDWLDGSVTVVCGCLS